MPNCKLGLPPGSKPADAPSNWYGPFLSKRKVLLVLYIHDLACSRCETLLDRKDGHRSVLAYDDLKASITMLA